MWAAFTAFATSSSGEIASFVGAVRTSKTRLVEFEELLHSPFSRGRALVVSTTYFSFRIVTIRFDRVYPRPVLAALSRQSRARERERETTLSLPASFLQSERDTRMPDASRILVTASRTTYLVCSSARRKKRVGYSLTRTMPLRSAFSA